MKNNGTVVQLSEYSMVTSSTGTRADQVVSDKNNLDRMSEKRVH